MLAIEARDLHVQSGKFSLTVPHLRVEGGQCLGIVGPNGSGKSTLIRALAGLIASAGELTAGDQNVGDMSELERARTIAWVPQSETHHFDFSVEELVATATYVFESADIEGALTLFDARDIRNRSVRQISGGELQRVLLARAWATSAPILLLDEPTAHLDVGHMQDLGRLLGASDRTVIFASHDLNWATSVTHSFLVLSAGKVVGRNLEPATLRTAFGTEFATGVTPDGRTLYAAPI